MYLRKVSRKNNFIATRRFLFQQGNIVESEYYGEIILINSLILNKLRKVFCGRNQALSKTIYFFYISFLNYYQTRNIMY